MPRRPRFVLGVAAVKEPRYGPIAVPLNSTPPQRRGTRDHSTAAARSVGAASVVPRCIPIRLRARVACRPRVTGRRRATVPARRRRQASQTRRGRAPCCGGRSSASSARARGGRVVAFAVVGAAVAVAAGRSDRRRRTRRWAAGWTARLPSTPARRAFSPKPDNRSPTKAWCVPIGGGIVCV